MTTEEKSKQQRQIQLLRQIRLALTTNDFDSALDGLKQLAALAHLSGDAGAEGRHLGNMALIYYRLNRPGEALNYFNLALALARRDDDRLTQSGILGNIGNILRELERFAEARKHLNEALSIAHELGDRRGRGIWLGNLALVYDDLKQPDEASRCHKEAVEIARELQDKRGLASRLSNLGNCCVSKGDPKAALSHFEEAAKLYEELGEKEELAVCLGMMANLHGELGRVAPDVPATRKHLTAALELCLRTLDLVRDSRNPESEAAILLNIGDALVASGQPERALEYYRSAVKILETMDKPEQLVAAKKKIAAIASAASVKSDVDSSEKKPAS